MEVSPDLGPFEPFVKAILEQVPGIAVIGRVVVNGRVVDQEPAHVAPEEAGLRAMRVARLIGVLMVHAVDCDPVHGAALPATRAQDGQRMLQPARAGEATVRQQAMIANVDAEGSEEIKSANRPGKPRPAEQPRYTGQQGEQMKTDDACEDLPVDMPGAGGVESNHTRRSHHFCYPPDWLPYLPFVDDCQDRPQAVPARVRGTAPLTPSIRADRITIARTGQPPIVASGEAWCCGPPPSC